MSNDLIDPPRRQFDFMNSQIKILLKTLELIAKGTCVMGGPGNEPCPSKYGDEFCYPHMAQQAIAQYEESNK